jgi:uncharacterized protein YdgA (DUF945 family)
VRKAVIVLLVILAAGLAAVPYWFGMQAEKTYHQITRQLENKGYISVVSSRYERGVLASTAETTFTIPGHSEPIRAVHEISHGPLPLDRLFSGEFDFEPVQAVIESHLSGGGEAAALDAVSASTRIKLNGGGISRISDGGLRAQAEDGSELTLEGIKGTLRFRPNLTRATGSLGARSLRVTKQDGDMTLNGVDSTFDVYSGLLGLSLGDATVKVDALTANSVEGSPPLSLRGLKFRSSAQDRGGAIDTTLAMEVREFRTEDAKGGPGEFAIQLRNLDAGALQAFEERSRQVQAKGATPEQQGAMMMGGLMDLLAGLGRRDPELEITRLRLVMPEGELTGAGHVRLDGDKLDGGPLAALNAVDAEAQLNLPAAMVLAMVELEVGMELTELQSKGEIPELSEEQRQKVIDNTAPGRVEEWAAARHLVKDNDHYRIQAALKDGLLTVNGEPFNPMQTQAALAH